MQNYCFFCIFANIFVPLQRKLILYAGNSSALYLGEMPLGGI